MRRRSPILMAICVAGCLWRSYGAIMEVHLEVLTQTADKLCSVVESGRGPTAEGMAEYVYPAKRAREFLRQFGGYSDRRSYQQFGVLLDRYEALVRDVDAARADRRLGPEEALRVTGEGDALRAMAGEIRTLLKNGN
jgi:hypothetical protein